MADFLMNPGRRRSSVKGQLGSNSVAVPETNVFRIPSNIDVALGLQWEFIGDDPVDLDASCVAFDEQGNFVEAIFFNNLTSEGGYMVHTGDNTTGEDDGDDDESLIFHMQMIPSNVHYMMVCVTSYTGANFSLVESAKVRLVNLASKEQVGGFSLAVVGSHTASLLCAFNRISNNPDKDGLLWWDMREVNIPCSGFTFCDLLPNMLQLLMIPPNEHERKLDALPDYSLEKQNEDAEKMPLSQVKFGLGWDGENDLDAALVMLDINGKYVDHVAAKYGKLRSYVKPPSMAEIQERVKAATAQAAAAAAALHANQGGAFGALLQQQQVSALMMLNNQATKAAVVHSGDKLNGFDVEGDDEFIEVDLMNVQPNVYAVYFLVFLYDGFAKSLGEVPRGYVRLINRQPKERIHKQVTQATLKDLDYGAQKTALVPYAIQRKDQAHWELVKVEESMDGTDWVDVFPFLRVMTKLHLDMSLWYRWKVDMYPFAIRVTIHSVRDLGPLEPHQFACHAWAWVCDKRWTPTARFRSEMCKDRDMICWDPDMIQQRQQQLQQQRPMSADGGGQIGSGGGAPGEHDTRPTSSAAGKKKNKQKPVVPSHVFIVNKNDVIRFMIFETAVVGYADVTMASFFGDVEAVTTESLPLEKPKKDEHVTMESVDVWDPNHAAGDHATTESGGSKGAASNGKHHSDKVHDHSAASMTFKPAMTSEMTAAVNGALRATEGAMMLTKAWLPLKGADVSGEVCVSIQRVPMPRSLDAENNVQKGWSCSVA